MTGFKKGTGSLNFEEDTDQEEPKDDRDQEQEEGEEMAQTTEQEQEQKQDIDSNTQAESVADSPPGSTADTSPHSPEFDMEKLPYLVQRQMRGASVNADRTNQLLLEVRPCVKEDEDTFLDDLQDLIDGPVYKGDAREAAMVVAQENPELVAEKLREWGIEYLDK